MSTTQENPLENPPDCYMWTEHGDGYVPKNAKWTCNFGGLDRPYKTPCGGRNEDIENKICSKCGNIRSYGSTADLGEKKPGCDKPEPLWMVDVEDDGSESWTIHFIID